MSIQKAVILHAWYNNSKPNWYPWLKKVDHKKIKKNVSQIYCLSSDNDPYFTAYQTCEMSKRLGGKFILIKGAGHFTAKNGITEIPQILQII